MASIEADASDDDEFADQLPAEILHDTDYRADTTRLRQDAKYVGFDNNVGDTWIYPTNYPVRRYQYDITHGALFRNTLVVLPTGLGKTFLAAVVMYNLYRWYPRGRVIFMAPTRPLVAQQIDACYQIMGIPRADTVELTGRQKPDLRADAWRSKRVFFCTPQVLAIDMLADDFPIASIKLLVIDEAHRARGRYAYTEVVRHLHRHNEANMRIMALSATPGRSVADVAQVVQNLRISALAVRSEHCADVAPYTHRKRMRTVVARLNGALRDVRVQFVAIIEPYVQRLLDADVIAGTTATLTKGWLVMQQKRFVETSSAAPGQRHPQHSACVSDFGKCISLYHALELLERHGVRIFLRFFDDADKSYLCRDGDLRAFVTGLRAELAPIVAGVPLAVGFDFGHPKYELLRSELRQHFEKSQTQPEATRTDATRALVFCEYRDSVYLIERMLQAERPLLRPRIFVGQGSDSSSLNESASLAGGDTNGSVSGSGSKAVTQKQQIATMAAFRAGEVNVLVATCVAEEGIDVGEIDLIVCFDISNKNPTRFVQRIGRTGRQRDGDVLMLVTEGREERMLRDVLANKDATNAKLAASAEVQAALVPSPRMVPTEFDPRCCETFVKIDGVVPLAKEGEETVAGWEARASGRNETAARGKRARVLPKGVQDVRQFFKPCNKPTTSPAVAAPLSHISPQPRSSSIANDLWPNRSLTPEANVSNCSTNSSIPARPPPSPRRITDARILQNLKNLPKIKQEFLGSSNARATRSSVLSVRDMLKRGAKVPESLRSFVLTADRIPETPSAADDKFADLFKGLDMTTDANGSDLEAYDRVIETDEDSPDDVRDAADSDRENVACSQQTRDVPLPPIGTQLPAFIDNEPRYQSYVQSQRCATTAMHCSTPIEPKIRTTPVAKLLQSSSTSRSLKRQSSMTPDKTRTKTTTKTPTPKKTPSATTTPYRNVPIREAFKKMLELRSPLKTVALDKISSEAKLLAYFQLRSILDVFDDSGADEQPVSNLSKNLAELMRSLSADYPNGNANVLNESIPPNDASIVISSADESANKTPDTIALRIDQSDLFDGNMNDVSIVLSSADESGATKEQRNNVIKATEAAHPKDMSSLFNGTILANDVSIVLSSDDESNEPAHETVTPDSKTSALDIGTIDDIFGSDAEPDDKPHHTAAAPADLASADSDEVIPGSQDNDNAEATRAATNTVRRATNTISAKLAQKAASASFQRNAAALPMMRPISADIFDVSTRSEFDATATTSGLTGGPSSQKENELPKRNSIAERMALNESRHFKSKSVMRNSISLVPMKNLLMPPNVLQPNAVSTTRPTIASSTDDDLDFELASNKLNSSGALSKRAPSSSRRVLDDATSSDDDFVSKETPTALASKQQQRRPSKCRPKMPQRQRKPPPRSSFVDDQCAVSDDADCSADEMLDGTAMLDGLICDADVDQTVNASMRAIYLQSIRSPCNPRGAYRLKTAFDRRPFNRSDIFSQAVAAESSEPSDDSFIVQNVGTDEDDAEAAENRTVNANDTMMDPLERAELILRQRRQAKRLGIVLRSDEDGADDDADDDGESQVRRPKKRRRLLRVLSSNDEDEDDGPKPP